MKIAETKTNSSSLQKRVDPFFQRGGESDFLSSNRGDGPFFSGKQNSRPPIQTKLTIGQPNDKYEREADAVADRVVQRMSVPDAFTKKELNVQTKPLVNSITPFLQAKCSTCEQEEKLQKKEEEDIVQESPLGLHLKPIFESNAEPDDTKSIQRKCAECENEDRLQKKSDSTDSQVASSSIENSLNSSKGNGAPLPEDTRTKMESSFGVDFSGVRLHTDSSAVKMNRDLHAQAFTHGNDIYFGSGKYDTGSSQGKHLLAHELTHTIQQNPGVIKSRKTEANNKANDHQSILKSSDKVVQRFYTFAPEPGRRRPKGTTIHSLVLPLFAKKNTDLFVEVAIPGAKAYVKDIEKRGIADFYKADPTGGVSRTIGVRFKDDRFQYLKPDGKLAWGGGEYNHNKTAAPIGPTVKGRNCAPDSTAEICRLDLAPKNVFLGDLKPGGSAEPFLGTGQIKDYFGGLTLTANQVNSTLTTDPATGHPSGQKWTVTPSVIDKMDIPDELVFPSGKGIVLNGLSTDRLSVYAGNKKVVEDSGLRGSLYVYKDGNNGVWSYEWFPNPSGLIDSPEPSVNVEKALDRLHDEVIPGLQKKSDNSYSYHYTETHTPVIQRQPKGADAGSGTKFDLTVWENKRYTPWKNETKAVLGDSKKLGKAPVSAALVEAGQRLGKDFKLSDRARKTGKGLPKLDHWVAWGGFYGRLRGVFGNVFLKIVGVYEKVKERFEKPSGGKDTNTHNFGSGPVGAAVKVAFGLIKQFLKITANKVVTNLKNSLESGATNLVKHIFSGPKMDKFLENFDALKAEIDSVNSLADKIHEKFETTVGNFLKEYEDEFKFLKEIKDGLQKVGDIISIVKWGIRIFHCFSPPLLGCIKLAFEKLSNALIEAVVKSCWFQEKAIRPLFNTIKFFQELPVSISNSILGLLRKIIPLPETELNILLPKIASVPGAEVKKGELKCDPDKPTPEQRAILKLIEKYGEEKVELMAKLLEAKDVKDGAKLSLKDIANMEKVIKEVTPEQLKEAIKHPEKFKATEFGKGIDELVNDIKSEGTKEEFDFGAGIMEAAENAEKLAALVKDGGAKGYYNSGWTIVWSDKIEKEKKGWAIFFTNSEGENVAAGIFVEFIDLNKDKNWVVLRVVKSSNFVNEEAKLLSGTPELKLYEGPMTGKSLSTK